MEKIRLLLADDTLIAREGWKKILETANDIEVVGEVKTATEALRIVKELQPDVLLTDLNWFGDETAGWATIREIKRTGSKVKIIAVTSYENLIRDARFAGADSALLKTFTREELLNEIREQASRPDEPTHATRTSLDATITDRELEVLKLMAGGHSDKSIAAMLNIAPMTAKNHIKNILDKLNSKNRTSAVSVALRMGLIKIEES